MIGGIGWYHRSGETTTPGVGVICDPYWSWWYGCAIGSVNIITGSRSANSFGENIGAGITYRLGESHAKLYTEVRYHHASYDSVSTNLIPLTLGILVVNEQVHLIGSASSGPFILLRHISKQPTITLTPIAYTPAFPTGCMA